MIDFNSACTMALHFYEDSLHITGLSEAYDTPNVYIFGGGVFGKTQFGSCLISLNKENGSIVPLRFPSKENSSLLRNATPLEIPPIFRG